MFPQMARESLSVRGVHTRNGLARASLEAAVEPDFAIRAALAVKLVLEAVGRDLLLLWEDGEGQRQHGKGRHRNQPKVDADGYRRRHPRPGPDPFPLHQFPIPGLLVLHVVEEHGWNHHDGAAVEDAAGGRLVHGQLGGLAALAQRRHISLRFALGLQPALLLVREHRTHVDARLDLAAAHEIGVESAGRGDGGKGHETLEDVAGAVRDAQPRDQLVQAERDGARGRDGNDV